MAALTLGLDWKEAWRHLEASGGIGRRFSGGMAGCLTRDTQKKNMLDLGHLYSFIPLLPQVHNVGELVQSFGDVALWNVFGYPDVLGILWLVWELTATKEIDEKLAEIHQSLSVSTSTVPADFNSKTYDVHAISSVESKESFTHQVLSSIHLKEPVGH